ncbi:MAG: HAMP domain-containing histidine kinase [Pseudomonadota bacterium]|uniref:sensor histidine kinase n=1 Tax=Polaromonas sp. TaxID=1869339 RepID=UPI001810D22C|nr:HAMP domain-containing sensor histidine kinase [Polaromonas sp.]MBA3593122.1 HAMP domain-containing histidine kinase [Polaromonas sp.]MDQ3273071.1 HAMP domain-containing histidine kinase [Pseudomonadota bacterium]
MLHEFLSLHRDALIDRCIAKTAKRSASSANNKDLEFGIPLFLDQVIKTLEMEQSAAPVQQSMAVSGLPGGPSQFSELGAAATRHGRELSLNGFTVEQVVHDYGDLCQAITDLASELGTPIETEEFRTLNRCLDNGIADAVTEFSNRRKMISDDRESQALNQRLGFVAHELRNHINTAMLAVSYIKAGAVGFSGATGGVLDRSLLTLKNIVDHSLADVRMKASLPPHSGRVNLADFIATMASTASLEAQSRGCELSVTDVDPAIFVDVDEESLASALGNLLQNAFKFTQKGTRVSLTVHVVGDRIRIDVQDQCGGLPPGNPEDLFLPFKQGSADKSGVGLGLSICRRSVEANKGVLSVRDLPGTGCVFSIDLPMR